MWFRTVSLVFSSLILLSFLFRGLYYEYHGSQNNRCSMTYMFEFPQYIRIPLEKEVEAVFKDYSLFCYGEGRHANNARDGLFFGVPVLFVPGNAGSHEQARSLASVALRKALDDQTRFHFDFFTVELNEEYSAIYGGVLENQSKYLQHCIDTILELYDGKDRPSSVVVIGHSMGGMVAKSLFATGQFDPSKVHTLITLATPHADPVISADYVLRKFYNKIKVHWMVHAESLNSLVIASIGGGHRDFQVRSGLTALSEDGVSTLTTAMPKVWLETDHLCIVWCKEVVLAVVRSLFDLVDPDTRQIVQNVEARKEVLQYHLIERNGGKSFHSRPRPRDVQFPDNAIWREVILRQMTVVPPIRGVEYYMFQAMDNPRYETLVAVAHLWDVEDWVFACTPLDYRNNARYCANGKSLTYLSELLPKSTKTVTIDLAEIRRQGYTHVAFVAPAKLGRKPWLDVDIHTRSARTQELSLPRLPLPYPFGPVATYRPEGKSVAHRYILPSFTASYQSYEVMIKPQCSESARRGGFVKFEVPWSREGFIEPVRKNASISLTLQLQVPKSKYRATAESPELQLLLSPNCSYTVEFHTDISGNLVQLLRFYGTLLPGVCVALALEVLRRQLSREDNMKSFFFTATKISLVRLWAVPKAMGLLIGFISMWKLSIPFIAPHDELRLEEKELENNAAFPVLIIIAWAVCYVLALIIHLAVGIVGNATYHIVLRVLMGRAIPSEKVVDLALQGAAKFPFVVSTALIAVACGGCGALGLVCGFMYHIVKLFKMYQSLLENKVKGFTYNLLGVRNVAKKMVDKIDENAEEDRQFLNFHSTLALLWFFACGLNAPVLMHWWRNRMRTLEYDPSFYPAVAMFLSSAILWQEDVPKSSRTGYASLSTLISSLSTLGMLYGLIDVYRSNYIIAVAFVAIAGHQMFSKHVDDSDDRKRGTGNRMGPLKKDPEVSGNPVRVDSGFEAKESSHEISETENPTESERISEIPDSGENSEMSDSSSVHNENQCEL